MSVFVHALKKNEVTVHKKEIFLKFEMKEILEKLKKKIPAPWEDPIVNHPKIRKFLNYWSAIS